ncbi:hypothetical protein Tco_0798858 [Tanacetum coccineum]
MGEPRSRVATGAVSCVFIVRDTLIGGLMDESMLRSLVRLEAGGEGGGQQSGCIVVDIDGDDLVDVLRVVEGKDRCYGMVGSGCEEELYDNSQFSMWMYIVLCGGGWWVQHGMVRGMQIVKEVVEKQDWTKSYTGYSRSHSLKPGS